MSVGEVGYLWEERVQSRDLLNNGFEELFRACRWDIGRFAREMLGVDGHPAQVEMWNALLARDASQRRPAYLTLFVSAGNRAGKTLGLAIAILHSTLYKLGAQQPVPDMKTSLQRWLRSPYEWYHFGIHTEVAELVWVEMVKLFTGTHEAQRGRGCPLVDAFGSEVIQLDAKYRGEYRWVRWSPVFGGGQVHFRTTGERALAALGRDMHGISWDECAFDPNLAFVFNEVLNMRRLSTSGQFVLISTPTEGLTDFADLFATGDHDLADHNVDRKSLRMSTRSNIGFGIDKSTFDRLIDQIPPYLVPQNIDGHFIEGREQFFATASIEAAFTAKLPEHQEPKRGHRYVQGVDPALTYDQSWSIVLDVTDPQHIVGVSPQRRTGRQTADALVALASLQHFAYNNSVAGSSCHTAIDATGFGGKVFRSLLTGLAPVSSVEFGGKRQQKVRLLNNLRSALDAGRLAFPRSGLWLQLRRQLLGYKLNDRGLSTDAVMALAVAYHQASRMGAANAPTVAFDYFGVASESKGVSSHPGATQLRVANHRITVSTRAELGYGDSEE